MMCKENVHDAIKNQNKVCLAWMVEVYGAHAGQARWHKFLEDEKRIQKELDILEFNGYNEEINAETADEVIHGITT